MSTQDIKIDIVSSKSENSSPIEKQINGCLLRTLGCGQCLVGCVGCPVFSILSLLAGSFMTVKACVCLNCTSDNFLEERNEVCYYGGIGTGCAISSVLIISGCANLSGVPISTPKKGLTYQSEMIR